MAGPDRAELAELVRRLSVVHGRVTLSSGREADYYVDLRRATLHHRASALIGPECQAADNRIVPVGSEFAH